MAELDFVWVQQCEVCGCEHQHMEHHVIPVAARDAEADAFHARCRTWYRAHVEAAQAFESLTRHGP